MTQTTKHLLYIIVYAIIVYGIIWYFFVRNPQPTTTVIPAINPNRYTPPFQTYVPPQVVVVDNFPKTFGQPISGHHKSFGGSAPIDNTPCKKNVPSPTMPGTTMLVDGVYKNGKCV